MGVERPDDGFLFSLGQSRGTFDRGEEHCLTQLEVADAEWLEPTTQLGEERHQLAGRTGQVELVAQGVPGRLVHIDHSSLGIEDEHPFAEGVQKALGEG